MYAICRRHTRRGPQDVGYIEGVTNLRNDFPSRSYEKGFPIGSESAFLLSSLTIILCLLSSDDVKLSTLRNDHFSKVCSILGEMQSSSIQPVTVTGGSGVGWPHVKNIITYLHKRFEYGCYDRVCMHAYSLPSPVCMPMRLLVISLV
jgi:hypothetical protein